MMLCLEHLILMLLPLHILSLYVNDLVLSLSTSVPQQHLLVIVYHKVGMNKILTLLKKQQTYPIH